MRRLLPLLLLVGLANPICGLGRLVQPGGSQVALGEVSDADGRTLLFPPQAVPALSWLTLPAGCLIDEAKLIFPGGRKTLHFPTVAAPDVRIAFQIPDALLSLTLRGRLPSRLILLRSVGRPGGQGAWITRSLEDLRVDLPPWKVASGFVPGLLVERTGTTDWQAEISGAGKDARRFEFAPGVVQWVFSPDAWGFFPNRIEISGANASLADVRIRAYGPRADLPVDPKTLIAWTEASWRNPRREWFSWSGTSVLVLLSRDYRVQDDYLKRLAFYVEKTGFRGQLITDEAMAGLHGWNAHDYSAPDMARFFTEAASGGFALNASETELRERLIAAGILVPRGQASWEAGTGALVGISQQSPPALRRVLFVHEAFHGLYYTSPEFRQGVLTAWEALSEQARRAFRAFLASSDYDPSFEALMVNEFQAYVLQRSAAEWPAFFRERVLAKVPPQDVQAWLTEFLAAARTLDALVARLYGLKSGEVSLVTTP